MYGIRFGEYPNINTLKISELNLEKISNSINFHHNEIKQILGIKENDYNDKLINEFNATIYSHRKRFKEGDQLFSELVFVKEEDAKNALDWLNSLAVAKVLSQEQNFEKIPSNRFIGNFQSVGKAYFPTSGDMASINGEFFVFQNNQWLKINKK